MTHTPGPWTTGRGMFDAILAADDSLVCRLSTVDYRTGKQINRSNHEDLANARLIAAAPRLLEALRGLVKAVEADGDLMSSVVSSLIVFAEVVIVEALGQESS